MNDNTCLHTKTWKTITHDITFFKNWWLGALYTKYWPWPISKTDRNSDPINFSPLFSHQPSWLLTKNLRFSEDMSWGPGLQVPCGSHESGVVEVGGWTDLKLTLIGLLLPWATEVVCWTVCFRLRATCCHVHLQGMFSRETQVSGFRTQDFQSSLVGDGPWFFTRLSAFVGNFET